MMARISLWMDSVSEPRQPQLIVSHDLIDDDGGALHSKTVGVFAATAHDAAEQYARQYAKRHHLPMVDETGRK